MAGRSQSKLEALCSELTSLFPETPPPPILLADIAHAPASLACFQDSVLVLNCSGPFRFLGMPVVEACVAHGTHYMDISGEPQFMEQSFLALHEAAIAKNVLILHSCAFDSVPADLGFLFTRRQFPFECCSSIESILQISAPKGFVLHTTTYECAVHG